MRFGLVISRSYIAVRYSIRKLDMIRYIRTVHDLAITLQHILDISARTYTRYFTQLNDDTVADDDFARLIELAADAVDAVTIIDAKPDDDFEPNPDANRNTDPDPSNIRSSDNIPPPLIESMAADVRAMERRVDNSELNNNPKPNLKTKPMRRKPVKRGAFPRHRHNMTVKGAALMEA